jgi:hypothetical protein
MLEFALGFTACRGVSRRVPGAVAQLVAHLVRNEGVRGSSPLSSTERPGQAPSPKSSPRSSDAISALTQSFVTSPSGSGRCRPWARRSDGDVCRYNPATTTQMTTALPLPTALPAHPGADVSRDAVIDLPAGLTGANLARITAAMGATRAESTRAVYGNAWAGWQRWCDSRVIVALPGDPLALCAYLSERAETGRAMATLDLSCTAIRYVHRTCGAADPVAAESVRLVRPGLGRTYGRAPRRLARPLGVDDVRRIVTAIDASTPIGIRDHAVILVGYASAMRRSEPVALTLADGEHKPAGLLLAVPAESGFE